MKIHKICKQTIAALLVAIFVMCQPCSAYTKETTVEYSKQTPSESDGGIAAARTRVSADWIDAYRRFLTKKEYLSCGLEFGNSEPISGKYFDMDHDGIPELILENGYWERDLRRGYVFTYVSGMILYIGNGPSDAYTSKESGIFSDLFGYYHTSGYLTRYNKEGNTIVTKTEEILPEGQWDLVGENYSYVSKKSIQRMISELSFYDWYIAEYAQNSDCVFMFAKLEELLFQYDACNSCGIYDCKDVDSTNPNILKNLLATNYETYGIEKRFVNREADPLGKFTGKMYVIVPEEAAHFLATNIYNISETDYERLLNALLSDGDNYLHEGELYLGTDGVGDYSAVNNYLEFHLEGEYILITYEVWFNRVEAGADPLNPNGKNTGKRAEARTACLLPKEVKGRFYWSLYTLENGCYADSRYWKGEESFPLWEGSYRYSDDEKIVVKSVDSDGVTIVQTGLTSSGESDFETEKKLLFTDSSKTMTRELFQDGKSYVYYRLQDDRITVYYPQGWWAPRDYLRYTELPELTDRYKPYRTIALKSKSNGCYVTCDIGGKNANDEYEHFNEPELHMDATKIGAYEMFDLIPCPDGSYALRSIMNRQYLSKNPSKGWGDGFGLLIHSYVHTDFVKNETKLTLDLKSKYTTIKFQNSDDWMSYASGFLEPNSDRRKAEEFEIIYLTDNAYTDEEVSILTSGEWYNLDGKGKGYWDIQFEIGEGRTDALEKLGYTPMHVRGENKTVIQDLNMQCAVGVKVDENGFYDVIVTFQGTGGFSGDTPQPLGIPVDLVEDVIMSLLNPGGKVDVHPGYLTMVYLFHDIEDDLVANVNGDNVRYLDLLKAIGKHRGRITILGHSMGGAMAQIYAIHLLNYGIDPHMIKGRTFNAALAVTKSDEGACFSDWYNLCVSTDTVTNGLVTNSLAFHGVHRIGRTIWLYDNVPDKDIGGGVANISEPKHNMDRKLNEILSSFSASKGFYKVNKVDLWAATNRKDVPIYAAPNSESERMGYILEPETIVHVKGYVVNEYGNKWLRLSNGMFVYSKNIWLLQYCEVKHSAHDKLFCVMENTPVRSGFSYNAEIVDYLNAGEVEWPSAAVKYSEGHYWLRIGKGWVYAGYFLVRNRAEGQIRRLQFDCPIDIEIYDSDNKLIAYIYNDGTMKSEDAEVATYAIGNTRFFDIVGDKEYKVKVKGLADGAMDYVVYDSFDEISGEFLNQMAFYDVELEEQKLFESVVGNSAKEITLKVVNESGDIVEEIQGQVSKDGSDKDDDERGNDIAKTMIIIVVALLVLTLIITCFILIRRKRRKGLHG